MTLEQVHYSGRMRVKKKRQIQSSAQQDVVELQSPRSPSMETGRLTAEGSLTCTVSQSFLVIEEKRLHLEFILSVISFKQVFIFHVCEIANAAESGSTV